MPHYLYEAKDAQGRRVDGSVEVNSAQEAVSVLRQRGLQDIRIQSTALTTALQRQRLSHEAAQKSARAQLRFRRHGHFAGLLLSMAAVARNHGAYLLAITALISWDIYRGKLQLLGLEIALLSLPFLALIWRRRHVSRYRRLQLAMVYGRWREAETLISLLRARPNINPQLAMDLDVREAQIRVRQGVSVDDAIAALASWRQPLAKTPGAFEARLGGIYSAARDYPGYLRMAHIALELRPQEPTQLVDTALAEARFGSTRAAEALLARVDTTALIAAGHKFMDWVRGIISLREGRPDAGAHLLKARLAFVEMAKKTPTSRSTLALCTAAYCITLSREGKTAEARRLVRQVWPVLQVVGDPELMRQLAQEVGGLPQP